MIPLHLLTLVLYFLRTAWWRSSRDCTNSPHDTLLREIFSIFSFCRQLCTKGKPLPLIFQPPPPLHSLLSSSTDLDFFSNVSRRCRCHEPIFHKCFVTFELKRNWLDILLYTCFSFINTLQSRFSAFPRGICFQSNLHVDLNWNRSLDTCRLLVPSTATPWLTPSSFDLFQKTIFPARHRNNTEMKHRTLVKNSKHPKHDYKAKR